MVSDSQFLFIYLFKFLGIYVPIYIEFLHSDSRSIPGLGVGSGT